MRRPALLALAAAAVVASAGPGLGAPDRAPRVVVHDLAVHVGLAGDGADRCRPPDGSALSTAGGASVAQTADGLVVAGLRYDDVQATGTTSSALLSPGGHVTALAAPGSQLCPQADDGRTTRWPVVAADGAGRAYLATALEAPAAAGAPPVPVVQVAVRGPGEADFAAPVVVAELATGAGELGLTADPAVPDRMWLTWFEVPGIDVLAGQVQIARTDDGGRSWSAPVRVTVASPVVGSPFGPRLAVLPDGRLVLVVVGGSLGSVVNQPAPASPSRSVDVVAFSSGDGGATWSAGSTVLTVSGDRPDEAGGAQLRFIPQVAVAATEDGRVHVVAEDYREAGGGALPTAVSADGGLSWQAGPTITSTGVPGAGRSGLFKVGLASRPGGVLAASWTRADDTPDALVAQVFAAATTSDRLARGLGWGSPVPLGPATDRRAVRGSRYFLESNEIGVTRTGFAVAHQATVQGADGRDLQVHVSTFDVRP